MKSPGHPSLRREVEREFWKQIATGSTSEAAAAAVDVSQAVGTRWFRHGGGMPPMDLDEPTGRYLSFVEREEIALLRAKNYGVRAIAREIDRSPSTVSRELRRNAATRGGKLEYRASVAQWKAELIAKRYKPCKLVENPRLHAYVQDRLSGAVCATDGTSIGPAGAPWSGRNKPHRGDRRWTRGWSPEQISQRLRVDFPDDETMRISHEAIYQALYIESRGALKRELVHCLRTGRALRVPRARARNKAWAHVTPEVMICERPGEADDRSVPGHWEGDLIIGLKRSAIGTIVDWTTRFTMLIHLPREAGYGTIPRTKNGPALAGYGAITMSKALATSMSALPAQLARSLSWDRGKELSAHTAFTVETGIPVFFTDPHSPWQRGTNENTNGLLRQYFPKGTDLSRWDNDHLEAVAAELNSRPRKTLGWRTPPKHSTITYAPSNKAVLHPPIESAQYTSWAFTHRALESGLVPSMGSIGDCYDNGQMESFWARMQVELLNRKRWNTRLELANAIFEYLEIFHNRQRRHSSLGMLSPIEYELRHADNLACDRAS